MAVTGYVFEISMEKVVDRTHGFSTIGFKDTQLEALTLVNEHATLMGIYDIALTSNEGNVVIHEVSGKATMYPDAQIILRIKIVSVAEALNTLLARVQK